MLPILCLSKCKFVALCFPLCKHLLFQLFTHTRTLFSHLSNSNGRPGEATVVEEFRMDWGTYMSSHNDIVYIRLDVRGAKGQGKKKLFRHLGGVEVDDRIAAVE